MAPLCLRAARMGVRLLRPGPARVHQGPRLAVAAHLARRAVVAPRRGARHVGHRWDRRRRARRSRRASARCSRGRCSSTRSDRSSAGSPRASGPSSLGRAIVGLGVGGEWAIGHGMLAEAVPPERRGRWSAALQSGEPLGVAMAAIIGYLVLPTGRLAGRPHRLERHGAHRPGGASFGASAERARRPPG